MSTVILCRRLRARIILWLATAMMTQHSGAYPPTPPFRSSGASRGRTTNSFATPSTESDYNPKVAIELCFRRLQCKRRRRPFVNSERVRLFAVTLLGHCENACSLASFILRTANVLIAVANDRGCWPRSGFQAAIIPTSRSVCCLQASSFCSSRRETAVNLFRAKFAF